MAYPLRLLSPLLCLFILSLLVPPAATAQEIPTKWQSLAAPGGVITQLSASEDARTVYAVSTVAVNRQSDQTQWRDTGAATSADAIYRSTDGGANWLPATNDLPPGAITELFVDSRDESVWIGLEERSIEMEPRSGPWRSFDQGRTWQRVRLDRDGLLIRSIVRDAGGELVVGAVNAGVTDKSYVYRSADNGATWASAEVPRIGDGSGDDLAALVAHPQDAQLLFVVTTGGKLLRSSDGGRTWSCDSESPACSEDRRSEPIGDRTRRVSDAHSVGCPVARLVRTAQP